MSEEDVRTTNEIADAVAGLPAGTADLLGRHLPQVGEGSPVGEVTPTSEGVLYVDTATPDLWQSTGTTHDDWKRVSTVQMLSQENGDHLNNGLTTEVVVFRQPVSGELMGKNGALLMEFIGGAEGTGDVTFRAYFGPQGCEPGDDGTFQVCTDTVIAEGYEQRCRVKVSNRNSAVDQTKTPDLPMNTPDVAYNSVIACAVNTSDDADLILTAQCADADGVGNAHSLSVTFIDPVDANVLPFVPLFDYKLGGGNKSRVMPTRFFGSNLKLKKDEKVRVSYGTRQLTDLLTIKSAASAAGVGGKGSAGYFGDKNNFSEDLQYLFKDGTETDTAATATPVPYEETAAGQIVESMKLTHPEVYDFMKQLLPPQMSTENGIGDAEWADWEKTLINWKQFGGWNNQALRDAFWPQEKSALGDNPPDGASVLEFGGGLLNIAGMLVVLDQLLSKGKNETSFPYPPEPKIGCRIKTKALAFPSNVKGLPKDGGGFLRCKILFYAYPGWTALWGDPDLTPNSFALPTVDFSMGDYTHSFSPTRDQIATFKRPFDNHLGMSAMVFDVVFALKFRPGPVKANYAHLKAQCGMRFKEPYSGQDAEPLDKKVHDSWTSGKRLRDFGIDDSVDSPFHLVNGGWYEYWSPLVLPDPNVLIA